MPRRVQDIIPGEKRSIREIPVEKPRRPEEAKSAKDEAASDQDGGRIRIKRISQDPLKRLPVTPPPASGRRERPKNRVKWLFIALGTIIVVGGIAFIASSQYSRATFRIVPKAIALNVDGTYVAQASAGAGSISYSAVTIDRSASTTVPASDGAKVSTKAQGSVTLYNAYSAEPVRLIAGTRLANDSGLVYRLTGSVLIPGYTTRSGSVIPGTLRSPVIADQPGQSYNITKTDSLSDFKIVAYKDTPRYGSIYARIASDIVGGWIGTKKIVSPTVMTAAANDLRSILTQTLTSEMQGYVPDGFILYPSGIITSFSDPVISGELANSAVITINGSMTGLLFKESELISKFSDNQADSSFGKFGYEAKGLREMDFNITNIKDFSPQKKGSVVIKAKGNIDLVGKVPVEEIKDKLYGMQLSDTQDLLDSYSAVIKSGSGELVPPWAKIPRDPGRVTISIEES